MQYNTIQYNTIQYSGGDCIQILSSYRISRFISHTFTSVCQINGTRYDLKNEASRRESSINSLIQHSR